MEGHKTVFISELAKIINKGTKFSSIIIILDIGESNRGNSEANIKRNTNVREVDTNQTTVMNPVAERDIDRLPGTIGDSQRHRKQYHAFASIVYGL
jgi:hypothetical protein